MAVDSIDSTAAQSPRPKVSEIERSEETRRRDEHEDRARIESSRDRLEKADPQSGRGSEVDIFV